jgi:hypothetical protein
VIATSSAIQRNPTPGADLSLWMSCFAIDRQDQYRAVMLLL